MIFSFALLLISTFSFANRISPDVNTYTFESQKLSIQLEIPDEWKTKIVTEESENSVVFKYLNTGSDPVFLFSVNKVSAEHWMKIKDQLNNSGMLLRKDNDIYYYEKTSAASIRGANKEEYRSIVSNLDEVIKTAKSF